MTRYEMREDSGAREIIEADSIHDALAEAEEWAAGGSYSERVRVGYTVQEIDDDGEPIGRSRGGYVEAGPETPEPDCAEDCDHAWISPEWLGGCSENPGVWALGGTTISIREVCKICGIYRHQIRRGVQRNPGEIDTVEYGPADEASLTRLGLGEDAQA
jgi:hypothetical protein